MTKVPMIVNVPLKASIGICFELKSRYKMNVTADHELKRLHDEMKFRKDFNEFSKMIPNAPGKLIVIGFNGKESEIIDFVSSVGSLRGKFKESQVVKGGLSLSRYGWYKQLLYSNQFSKLKIQMVH
jgi:hypothetical protein